MFEQQCKCRNNFTVNAAGVILLIGLMWVILYIFFHDEVTVHGDMFKILALVLCAHVVGKLVTVFSLPPLLGMLVTGIIFRTSGFYQISGVYPKIVTVLRESALCVILVRAGLGLDAKTLLKLSLVVLRLALLPCLAETFSVAVASHFILGYPWLWGILLGFLMSAISPAVVVPCLLSLQERGYGEKKGIATLVIGASTLDDIVAISAFGVVLGLLFAKGSLTHQILQGPEDVLLGLVSGLGFGLIASFFPNKDDENIVFKRSFMIGGWSLLAVIGSQQIGFEGAGPLSCITAALTAGISWKLQGWDKHNPVSGVFSMIWNIMQTVLFSVIGAEIDLRVIDVGTILHGLAVIFCGLVCRVCACFTAVLGTDLNVKEKIFTNLAWLPKATVQAALAPKALDMVRSQLSPDESDLQKGVEILTIAVLAILITAPLGAIGVVIGGPLLLTSEKEDKDEESGEHL